MNSQPNFFDFAAEVGLTKHIGGIAATQALIELCHIDQDKTILDVGCGVGVTPCFLAKMVGCRVVGVDISQRMVERSKERAMREKAADRVEFRIADAQNLPFEDGLFDAVITESVTAFTEEKQQAMDEYARVTKLGGYVGLNETIWLKVPPPPEIVAWASQDVGANVKPLTSDAWAGLLKSAGLKEITVKTYSINTQDEARGILRRYGTGEMLRVMGRMSLLYVRSSTYRIFVKGARAGGVIPVNLDEYFGYGLFVVQK